MTDSNLYRFVEVNIIESLRADVEKLNSQVGYMKAQIDSFEQKIWQHESYTRRHDNYDYRISLIVITPESDHGKPLGVDETFFVSSVKEAAAKEKEIMERQNQLKRKVLVTQQSSLRPIPF